FSSRRVPSAAQSGELSSPGPVLFVGWFNAGTLARTMTHSCMRLGGDTKLVHIFSPLVCPEIPPAESTYWSESSPGGLWVNLSKVGFFSCGNLDRFMSL